MTSTQKRVLLVEDEPLVAMLIEEFILDAGHEVVGPAATIAKATALAESELIDFAILDVSVCGETSFVVAAILRRRDVPFLFATGYGRAALPDTFADTPIMTKPFDSHRLRQVLADFAD